MTYTPGNSQRADSPNNAGCWVVGFLMPILATLSIALRLTAKSQTKHKWGADDAVLVMAWAFIWAMSGVFLWAASKGGVGGHSTLNPVTHKLEINKHDYVLQITLFYFSLFERLALPLTKVGIVLWYRLVFVGRLFTIVSNSTLAFLSLMTVAFFFTSIFRCGADPSIWWSSLQEELARCINGSAVSMSFSVLDLFADLVVVSIPVYWIVKLKMSTSRRVAVLVTFMLGLISTAAAVARLFMWVWILYNSNLSARDFQGLTTQGLVCSMVSAGAAMTAACLPTLRPLLKFRAVASVVHSARNVGKSHEGSGDEA